MAVPLLCPNSPGNAFKITSDFLPERSVFRIGRQAFFILMPSPRDREAALVGLALEKPVAERAALLDAVCGGDAELRERLQVRLAAHKEPGAPPEGLIPTPEAIATIKLDFPDAPADEGVGTTLGHYKLREKVGEGGCGVVYVAEQTEPVRRRVALKLIKLGMDTREVIARFEAERQALAMMDHPNIAKVLDAGTTGSGRPYFVMELVRGIRITDYCDQANLSTKERLDLFTKVCQAVQHAHQKGIIHRDIKPSNILVTMHDGVPVPKVIDFGIAKATEGRLTDSTVYTQLHQFMGTPAYMSPEQAEMSGLDIDTRSDIYSLGVLLYQLLTGKTPFDGKELIALGIDEMRRTIREKEPMRPSTRLATLKGEELTTTAKRHAADAPRLIHQLKGDLDWIVMKCLEKDRQRRYETANGLAADLKRHLNNEPVTARPPSTAYRFQKALRRNKLAFVAVAAVTATLILGLAVSSWQMVVARRARSNEQQQRLKAESAQTKAEAEQQRALEKAEQLARQDYVNRVSRAYIEVQDDNIALAEDLLHGCAPESRGWEWHFVKRLGNSERKLIDLGRMSVNALAFSPDGTWVVAGSGDQMFGYQAGRAPNIGVWDVASGRQRKVLPGAKGTLLDVAFSPDGKRVAAGCKKGLVVVSDVESEQIVWSRTERELDAMNVAFSPDGQWLVAGYGSYSGRQAGRIKVWEAASGKEIKVFAGPRGGVNKLAFHPDGKRLALAGFEVVEILDLESGRKLLDLKGHAKWVYCLAYSPDGKWLATAGWDRTVKLREAATGVEVSTIFAHAGFVLSLSFSPDSGQLVTTSEDRSVRLWEIPSGRRLVTFHGHMDFVQAVAFRPDGREIATGGFDGTIRFWDLKTSRPILIEHTGWVENLAFRRDGLRVLSENSGRMGDELGTKGWNPDTGELDPALTGIRFAELPAEFVRGSGFLTRNVKSPDGKLVAETGRWANQAALTLRSTDASIGTAIIRETPGGRIVHILAGHSAEVASLAFTPDGRRLATASFDRTVKLWDTRTGQEVLTLRGHTAGVVSLAFSPDGNQLVSGGIDATARVWNAAPLAPGVLAEHDARYHRKVEALARLKTTRATNPKQP